VKYKKYDKDDDPDFVPEKEDMDELYDNDFEYVYKNDGDRVGNGCNDVNNHEMKSKDDETKEEQKTIDLTDMTENEIFTFDENEKICVYPEGDTDTVVIYRRDLECLKENALLNDTIIDFFFKYLPQKMIVKDKKDKFYFFSSYFYTSLIDHGYEKVKNWTKINIFNRDFLFVPINQHQHWRLIIVCYPSKFDEDIDPKERDSFLLILDSLGNSRFEGKKNLIDNIKYYLSDEWEKWHGKKKSFIKMKSHFPTRTIRHQDNDTDCGLFLIKYAEEFCATPPEYFDQKRLTKYMETRMKFSITEINEKKRANKINHS